MNLCVRLPIHNQLFLQTKYLGTPEFFSYQFIIIIKPLYRTAVDFMKRPPSPMLRGCTRNVVRETLSCLLGTYTQKLKTVGGRRYSAIARSGHRRAARDAHVYTDDATYPNAHPRHWLPGHTCKRVPAASAGAATTAATHSTGEHEATVGRPTVAWRAVTRSTLQRRRRHVLNLRRPALHRGRRAGTQQQQKTGNGRLGLPGMHFLALRDAG